MLVQLGHWMQRHGSLIRKLQWIVVLVYVFLIVVPVFLPLPDNAARVWNNMTIFAQFVFWGIWWPFVLLSMVLVGRVWCGVFCPEGVLTEKVSLYGRNLPIPHWIRWKGWPFLAFAGTTIYGQLVSVYQYPKAVLLVLGGSTLAAIVIGFLYGREKRVWCKYLCPVNGVFSLLAKLAPVHFKVNEAAWRSSYGQKVEAVNCAPLLPLRHMQGASACHMCGRCSGHRAAITLTRRSTSDEIVRLGKEEATAADSLLILYGLMGIAVGAFHWTVSPWFITAKQWVAEWLIDHDIFWLLDQDAPPWWLLTHYPEMNDSFSWLDGTMVVSYILLTALLLGSLAGICLVLANRVLGKWQWQRLYHLIQALIPVAGCGVFIGLSALTVNLLRIEGVPVFWASGARIALLIGANLWSVWLALKIMRGYTSDVGRWLGTLFFFLLALGVNSFGWVLFFWLW